MKRFKHPILIAIIIGLLYGFFNTLLIYEGFYRHFNKGLGAIHWSIHFLMVFLSLFLVICAHEIGHFISFVKNGIKPKAMYVLGIAFVDDNGWKIRFVPRFLLFIGGIVIPEHVTIDSKSKEDAMVNIFKKVLLAGPKASIIYGVAIFILWIAMLFTTFYVANGLLFTMMVVTTIMTILALLSSKLSRSGMYGDFAANKAFDKDKVFRLTYLIQLTTLLDHHVESMNYFWPTIVQTLEQTSNIKSPLSMNLLGQYLNEVVFEGRIACIAIENRLKTFVRKAPKNEDGLILYLNIVYYYEYMGQRNKVLELLNKLDTSKIDADNKVLMYYLKLTNHLLEIKDESAFLSNPKNIYTSSFYWVYRPLRLESELKPIIRY
jgi:hypothetical protein